MKMILAFVVVALVSTTVRSFGPQQRSFKASDLVMGDWEVVSEKVDLFDENIARAPGKQYRFVLSETKDSEGYVHRSGFINELVKMADEDLEDDDEEAVSENRLYKIILDEEDENSMKILYTDDEDADPEDYKVLVSFEIEKTERTIMGYGEFTPEEAGSVKNVQIVVINDITVLVNIFEKGVCNSFKTFTLVKEPPKPGVVQRFLPLIMMVAMIVPKFLNGKRSMNALAPGMEAAMQGGNGEEEGEAEAEGETESRIEEVAASDKSEE